MKFIAKPFVIIFLSALILVIIWFHEGYILGAAEAKIPFYNLDRFCQQTSRAWSDIYLGLASSSTIASGPTWCFLSTIQQFGIPGFLIQAAVFWLLFFCAGMGMYWLAKELFPDQSNKYLILAGFFYWFNPFSLVNVWNRFLYNYMVFWALLPLALYFFIKGLKIRKYISGIILSLTLTLFSYAFTAYVFNVLLWSAVCFTLIFLILINLNDRKFIFFSFKFFFLTFFFFIIFNAWWIFPLFSYLTASNTAQELSNFISPAGNIYTLTILSQKLGNLVDVMRLSHAGFYASEGPKWAGAYNFPLLAILLFGITGLIFFGIFRLRKNWAVLFLGSLFLLGIFLAVGNNPPFGGIFQFFFERISFLQIFRDPFEKFGFLISLAAAPLFVIGLKEFSGVVSVRLRKFIYPIGLIIILGVCGYPFFTGLVFTSQSPPNDDYAVGYKVKVPDDYKQADGWLHSQGSNFRFIGFPLGDEGITYNWEKGYQGVEPSEILFSTPGITFNTTIPYYSDIAEKLERLLFQQEDFYKVANLLNAKYFIVRNDVDIKERRLRKPEAIDLVLSKNEKEGKVKKAAQFGELTIWENLKWEDKTVYAAFSLVSVFPQAKITEALLPQVEDRAVLTAQTDKTRDKESLNVIYPETNISYEKKQRCAQLIGDFENPQKYNFNIDKQSGYELLLDNVNLSSNEASVSARLKVSVDGQPLQSGGQVIGGNRISYGKINLAVGKHEISLEKPATSNLVSASDNIIIKTPGGSNQASFKIENFNPYSRYLISFDVMLSGQQLVFYFQQNNDRFRAGNIIPECLNINILTQGPNFGGYTNVSDIYTPKRSDEAGVLFSSSPGQNTEAAVKKLSVQRLIEPWPVLVRENPGVQHVSQKISYAKQNPTEYSVQITGADGPFVLVLSELYNNGWEAILEDGTHVPDHFLANAYANGWLIDKKGDFHLILKFAPQKLLDAGRLVSISSIFAAIVYIGSVLLRKKGI